MLTLTLPATEDLKALTLQFEHSLVSLSKWEETYAKPFFGKDDKTAEETGDYIRFMVLGELPTEDFIDRLVREDVHSITEYINANRTGTTFPPDNTRSGQQEIITSELIYFWMISFKIPFYPAEHWHLSRLMTLIRIAGIKQTKPKKINAKERGEQYRSLNEQRRAEMGSAG